MERELVPRRFQRSSSNQSAKSSSSNFSGSVPPPSAPVDPHSRLASKYWKKFDGFVSAQALTVADGIRLLSFDYLFRRCYQYHLTQHTCHPNDMFQIHSQHPALDPEEPVVEMQTFKSGFVDHSLRVGASIHLFYRVHNPSTKFLRLSDLDTIEPRYIPSRPLDPLFSFLVSSVHLMWFG
jgi:hypothetical protein